MDSGEISPVKQRLSRFLERYAQDGVLGALVLDSRGKLVEQEFVNMKLDADDIERLADELLDTHSEIRAARLQSSSQDRPEYDIVLRFTPIFICIVRLKKGSFVIAAEARAKVAEVTGFAALFKRGLSELLP